MKKTLMLMALLTLVAGCRTSSTSRCCGGPAPAVAPCPAPCPPGTVPVAPPPAFPVR